MREFGRPNVVVSKCLGFAACRWNGVTIPVEFIKKLEPFVDFYPVCPEVEIGLGVPRDPIRIVSMKGEKKLVQPATGEDVSEKMLSLADRFLSSLGELMVLF